MVQVLCKCLWSLVSRWLKAICQFDPLVQTMVYDDLQGSIALCRDNMAEPTPFGTKTKKDNIQIYGRKIDKFTVQFVSWSLENISDWGNLWVQLSFEVVSCTFTFAFTATMHCFLDLCSACLLLLPSPEAHIKWFLHVVSQEAVKSRVGNVRAFAGDLHAFGLLFWFNSEKAWVKYCLAQHLWKRAQ